MTAWNETTIKSNLNRSRLHSQPQPPPIQQQEQSQKENISHNSYPKQGAPQEKIVDIKTFIREEHERQQNNESQGRETINMQESTQQQIDQPQPLHTANASTDQAEANPVQHQTEEAKEPA